MIFVCCVFCWTNDKDYPLHLYLILEAANLPPDLLVPLDQTLVLSPQRPDLHLELHVEVPHVAAHVRTVLTLLLLCGQLLHPGHLVSEQDEDYIRSLD